MEFVGEREVGLRLLPRPPRQSSVDPVERLVPLRTRPVVGGTGALNQEDGNPDVPRHEFARIVVAGTRTQRARHRGLGKRGHETPFAPGRTQLVLRCGRGSRGSHDPNRKDHRHREEEPDGAGAHSQQNWFPPSRTLASSGDRRGHRREGSGPARCPKLRRRESSSSSEEGERPGECHSRGWGRYFLVDLDLTRSGRTVYVEVLPRGGRVASIRRTVAVAVHAFNYWVLLGVRIAEGIGGAFYVTSSLATLAKRVPTEMRGRYMGLYVNALLLGQIMGPVIGGVVVLAWGLRAPFAVYALLASAGMAVVTFGLEPSAATVQGGRVDWTVVKRLLRDRSYVVVNIGTMGAFFARAGIVSTAIPLFIALNWGAGLEEAAALAGVLLTTNALAALITQWPSGMYADRRGRKLPFVTSLVLAGLIAPFLFFTHDLASAIPVMFAYGLVLGMHGPLASWTTDLTPPEVMGTSMGLYRTLGDIGFLTGPLVMSAVIELTLDSAGRITIAPFLVAAVWLVTAGLLMLLARDPVGERMRAARRTIDAAGRPGNSG